MQVMIRRLEKGSLAEEAGLKIYDRIVKIGDKVPSDINNAIESVKNSDKSKPLEIEVVRDNKNLKFPVKWTHGRDKIGVDFGIYMIVTTTDTIQGKTIKSYLGIVNGITVTGFGAVREFLSGFTDTLGGRSGSYEKEYRDAKEIALNNLKKEALKLSADAVVSIKLDYENISSKGGSFIMVTATGTAVKLEDVFEKDRESAKKI